MKPNPKFDHAYAIIRLDEGEPLPTVKKVMWDSEAAEKEAKRLNEVNQDKKCLYISQITRVERRGK